jgi:hypothetical protein
VTPAPTAAVTLAPTPEPTPEPTPTASPSPTPTPDFPDALELGGRLGMLPLGFGGLPVALGDGASMQVVDQTFATGLVETIVGDVAGGYFGY